MKTIPKVKGFFLGLIFIAFSKQELVAQSSTLIYGISTRGLGTSAFVSFDYSNGKYDTLFVKPDTAIKGENGLSALDSYRKIYYTMNSNYQVSGISIDSMKIYNQKPSSLHHTLAIFDLQYDIFNNELLARTADSLIAYEISTNKLRGICKLPHSSTLLSGFPCAYDNIKQQYFYYTVTTNNTIYKRVLVDVANSKVIDSSAIGSINDIYTGADEVMANTNNNSFIGIVGGSSVHPIPDLDIINPNNGSYTKIATFPSDYNGSLNFQRSCFNPVANLYIAPYYSTNQTNKLAMINVINGSIKVIPFDEEQYSNMHQLYYNPLPILKKANNKTLLASTCDNYVWYLNDTIIAGQNAQQLNVVKSGTYKFSTTRTDTKTYYSNIIVYNPTGISPLSDGQKITIQPNPADTYSIIHMDAIDTKEKHLVIYNINGQVLKTQVISSNDFEIDTKELNDGIYLYAVMNNSGEMLLKQKVIVHHL